MSKDVWLDSLTIKGFRPFRDFTATLGPLEVLIGANGSGKSALFEFLRFLRDGMIGEIPPEIVEGAVGQEVFHVASGSRLSWDVGIGFASRDVVAPVHYTGALLGPIGSVKVVAENVRADSITYLDVADREGKVSEPGPDGMREQPVRLPGYNQLTLSVMSNPAMAMVYLLRNYIRDWRFYSALNINKQEIKRPVPVEQDPTLREDARNLSSVLHYLLTEHRAAFDELQRLLRLTVPSFRALTVKARGGPGEVMGFWDEGGLDRDLSLADLSDGVLRLLCWGALCVHPKPPTLICVDEPDLGVHPRTLPILAGMFQKAAQRTQLIIATHSSYFLTQFDLAQIAVLRKENGEARFIKPGDSQTLTSILADFGPAEIEALHRSDELERLP